VPDCHIKLVRRIHLHTQRLGALRDAQRTLCIARVAIHRRQCGVARPTTLQVSSDGARSQTPFLAFLFSLCRFFFLTLFIAYSSDSQLKAIPLACRFAKQRIMQFQVQDHLTKPPQPPSPQASYPPPTLHWLVKQAVALDDCRSDPTEYKKRLDEVIRLRGYYDNPSVSILSPLRATEPPNTYPDTRRVDAKDQA